MAAALKVDAADDRLAADLARFPESSTLSGLALRDEAGAVVGRCCPTDALGLAYDAGTDAALIVEDERLASLIGQPADRHRMMARRLAHTVRAMNRRLRHWIDAQVLGTVTVCMTTRGIAVALALAEIDAERVGSALTASYGPAPPTPLDAKTSPHRPCAPPSPRAALLSDGVAVGVAS